MAYEKISVWQEHHFWLEILEDHAHFIHDYLSAFEKKFVDTALQYIKAFNKLRQHLCTINQSLSEDSAEMIQLAKQINPVALGYYQFEGQLQRLRIVNRVNLNLSPSYLNGTLSENQEYLRQLSFYMQGKEPPILPLVDLLDLWLEDQLGHSALLIQILDAVELPLLQQAEHFKNVFSAHIIKNDAIKGYLRFIKPGFSVQNHFAKEVAESVLGLNQLVLKVLKLYVDDEVLNQATLRFIEHHFPEACYFLRKLTYYTPDLNIPPCSLSKPSFRKSMVDSKETSHKD
ncbi:DUF2935 domain-containing protein [Pseudalkalibacillus decolorationis]|uniref:DUF2935 domain-containing protein n=1 Tax=Pseudalkalibacillus decolorationis TaxID=163879 RepID=UPI0021489E92|nr:DUF2935 domain-containing protein [Pseudalkalibacillus decolorationis]